MTGNDETIKVLKEISIKMDQTNKFLEYLCKCEDMKNEREIQRQKNMTEGLESIKTIKFDPPEYPIWTPPSAPEFH
jgi:hypothetical protein